MQQYNLVVIYSGRFQPFGPHHFQAYKHLCGKFGKSNVYICTSNVTNRDNSPLNFNEKSLIIQKHGIAVNRIVQVSSPYKCTELLSKYDPTKTTAVFAIGEKDSDRIITSGKSYFKPYTNNIKLSSFDKNGYAYVLPNFTLNGHEISGTILRSILPDAGVEGFYQIMGWYDTDLFKLMVQKFKSVDTKLDILEPLSEILKPDNHIDHPYENKSLTVDQIHKMLTDIVLGKIITTEKFDGQSMTVMNQNGQWVMSDKKGQPTLSPLTVDRVAQEFSDKPIKVQLFTDVLKLLNTKCPVLPNFDGIWLNIEILHPSHPNVFRYAYTLKLVIHNMMSSDGIKYPIKNKINLDFVICSESLKINNTDDTLAELDSQFYRFLKIYNLSKLTTIGDLTESEFSYFKNIFLLLTSKMIDLVTNSVISPAMQRLNFESIQTNLSRIYNSSSLPSLDNTKFWNGIDVLESVNLNKFPKMEGFVFTFEGNLYKITGSFGPLNQVLGYFKYKK